MSKQDKFFTKVKLFEKETKITASAILEKILIQEILEVLLHLIK
jgi:hypothetical protein